MKILAIETSLDACSVAISDGKQIFEKYQVLPQKHASVLLDWISQLLKEVNFPLSELDGIAYSCGPGSFTGIRIGAAVGQGIALAINKPLIAIPSLQAMAEGAHRKFGNTNIMILSDARMEQVYCGFYQQDLHNLMVPTCPDKLFFIKDVNFAEIEHNYWLLVTNALNLCHGNGTFKSEYFQDIITNYNPEAVSVLLLAEKELRKGIVTSVAEALPIYMQEDVWKKLKK